MCIGPEGEIIVADTRIIIFSAAGQFLRELGGGASTKEVGGAKGRYTGVSVDRQGHLLAAKTEKTKSYIQVSIYFPYFHSFIPVHLILCLLESFSIFGRRVKTLKVVGEKATCVIKIKLYVNV